MRLIQHFSLLVVALLLLVRVNAWPLSNNGQRYGRLGPKNGYLDGLPAAEGHSQRSGRSVPQPQPAPHGASTWPLGSFWRRSMLEWEYGVYGEVMQYLKEMDDSEAVDCEDAVKKQSLPSSASLGFAPWDTMKDLETLPARIAFINQLTSDVCSNGTGAPGPGTSTRVAVFTVWNGNLWGLRRSMLPWLQWHVQQGVCRFYVAFQGRDDATFRALQQIKVVDMILISKPFATPELHTKWLEYAASDEWGRRPGNWRLMSKQGFCGNVAFERARKEGMNWMMHIDADELVIPATSLAADLEAAPQWAAYLKMHNHEAVVEAFEVVNKYEEITLFKTHDQTLPNKTGDLQWRFRLGTHGAFYQVYYNGKSIARTDRAHVHMWGPHDFLGPSDETWKDPEHNPQGEFKSATARFGLVHISYASWHDLMGKARVTCPNEFKEAAKAGNITKVKECFCLDFDLHAYMAATKGEQAAREHWVRESLFSNGAVRKDSGECKAFHDVEKLKLLLIRDQIFHREFAPQQTLRAHELAIRAIAKGMGIKAHPLGLATGGSDEGAGAGGLPVGVAAATAKGGGAAAKAAGEGATAVKVKAKAPVEEAAAVVDKTAAKANSTVGVPAAVPAAVNATVKAAGTTASAATATAEKSSTVAGEATAAVAAVAGATTAAAAAGTAAATVAGTTNVKEVV